jgi:alanine racemase
LPVGYADGYPRACSNRSQVLVRGRRLPIVGRVCMDMSLIDVTDCPEALVGDRVMLFGEEDGKKIGVEEIAILANTFAYEIFCGISPRVPRLLVD